jgi:hypothetical protein
MGESEGNNGPDETGAERETAPGTGEGETPAGEGGTTDETGAETAEPTPQSAALRRQQRSVGVAGAVLAGAALGVGVLQRFPETPLLAAGAGLAGVAVVLWLVRKSVFPGEPAGAE